MENWRLATSVLIYAASVFVLAVEQMLSFDVWQGSFLGHGTIELHLAEPPQTSTPLLLTTTTMTTTTTATITIATIATTQNPMSQPGQQTTDSDPPRSIVSLDMPDAPERPSATMSPQPSFPTETQVPSVWPCEDVWEYTTTAKGNHQTASTPSPFFHTTSSVGKAPTFSWNSTQSSIATYRPTAHGPSSSVSPDEFLPSAGNFVRISSPMLAVLVWFTTASLLV